MIIKPQLQHQHWRPLVSGVRLLLLLLVLAGSGARAQGVVDIVEADIATLSSAMERGQVTSVELVQAYLDRIAAYDQQGPALNSIIRVNPTALEQAAERDRERADGSIRGPLHGIPVLLKDNYNTTFMPTTGGSVALAGFVPNANATQVDRLLQAGAVILAKTNLHEFAYGITTVGSLRGQTRNPYDIRRVPGGSSGGTGAAVAASLGAVGMGSDTCGSIRIPAAFNNLVGLRPSKGLGSIHGIMPLAHTQDVGGPLARSLADLAVVLDATSGHDPADAATAVVAGRALPAFSAALGSIEAAGLRLGRLSPYMARADGATRATIDAALDWYAGQGAEVVEVELAEALALIGASGVIGHEFRSDLNQYLTEFGSSGIQSLSEVVALGLHHEAVSGVLARSIASARDEQAYAEALATRARLRAAIESVLEGMDLDAIVYPVIAEQPVFIGGSQPGNNCSLSANSGLPALSLAVGFSAAGLPVGMELLGGFLDDARLLALAWPFEQAVQPRRPPSVTPALTGAQAPAATSLLSSLRAAGLLVAAEFTVDSLRNRLRYRVNLSAGDSAVLQALVLVIDEAEAGPNGSIHASLLGPGQAAAEGEIFMSPALRQALTENRVTLKLFAVGADRAGVTAPLTP